MAKIEKLTALEVKNAAPGRYGDGGGLWLTVRSGGEKSWSFRYTFRERRREMGLGAFTSVSLADAREKAAKLRRQVAKGKDPIEVKRAERRHRIPTFSECAEQYIANNKGAWKSVRTLQIWKSFIKNRANPIIGKIPVDLIVTNDIMKILTPIWDEKTETAVRLRRQIEAVLNYAAALNHRSKSNPAAWRGHLDKILPKPSKVSKVEHHRALSWESVPAFMRDLRKREGAGAKALELVILTAARSGDVRGATWDEIDLDGKVWTIPEKRMKAGVAHRVPLSSKALVLLKSLDRIEGTDLVFPSNRGTPISDMTISAVCKRMKVDAVPHGFRSSFKDWCSESTSYANEVSEKALAHAIDNKVEAAYRRGDLFAKREKLMQAWSDYCDKVTAKATVTPIRVAT